MLLIASTTAVEVTVAPDSASTSSPRVTGMVLPMNCSAKAASVAQRVPKPEVSLEESMVRAVISLFSPTVKVTVTLDWKPAAEAV